MKMDVTHWECKVCGEMVDVEKIKDHPHQFKFYEIGSNGSLELNLPKIDWIQLDPKRHCWFEDGSRFLVALQVENVRTGKKVWEFDVVVTECDGDGMHLRYEGGEYYDKWNWFDFEFFYLLDGKMPSAGPEDDK